MARSGAPLSIRIALAAGVGFSALFAVPSANASFPANTWPFGRTDQPVLVSATSCPIKGNISRNTGERIYHVPGQRHYHETVIDESAGERWFCSEDEARAAGWRKSKR